jgi:hypothetical protein
MILWAELAAWLIRAALISLWFSVFEIFALLTPYEQGFIHNYVLRYLMFCIFPLLLNIIVSGKLKIYSDKKIPNNVEGVQYFTLSTLNTLKFLLQGSRARNVKKNITVLSGLKKVYLTPNGDYLFIEDVEPVKKIEYFKTIIFILGGITLLFIAPAFIIKTYDLIAGILLIMGFPKDFSRFIIFTAGFTILPYYLGPYTLFSNFNYKNSVVFMFLKRLDGTDINIYESPMMAILTNHPWGMYHNNKIIINPLIFKNQKILRFVIAHEEGHISDPYCETMRKVLSPILFPLLAYIIAIIISYLCFIGKLHYDFWLIFILAGTIVSLIFMIFIKIEENCQERADDFAVKKLGKDYVIKVLQEIAYGDDILPEKYINRSKAIKQIERLKQK